jgi:hypothetical protein
MYYDWSTESPAYSIGSLRLVGTCWIKPVEKTVMQNNSFQSSTKAGNGKIIEDKTNTIRLNTYLSLVYLCFLFATQTYATNLRALLPGPVHVVLTFAFYLPPLFFLLRLRFAERRMEVKLWLYLPFLLFYILNVTAILFGGYFGLFQLFPFALSLYVLPALFFTRAKWLYPFTIAFIMFWVCAALFAEMPYNTAGNMLEYVSTACDLLINGKNPYLNPIHVYSYMYESCGYGPFLLIPYLPFRYFRADIRFLNVVVLCAVLVFLGPRLRYGEKENHRNESLLIFSALILLQSSYVLHLIVTKHIFFYGVIVALLAFFCLSRSSEGAGVFSALAFATRQFAVILFPFVVFFRYRSNFRMMVVAISICAIVFLPFMYTAPTGFVNAFFFNALRSRLAYDADVVEFGSGRSPGGGSGFNLGHLLKYYFPGWKSRGCAVLFFLFYSVVFAFYLRARSTFAAVGYVAYWLFLAFATEFSPYFLWGLTCWFAGARIAGEFANQIEV